jgi:hypothetical protein
MQHSQPPAVDPDAPIWGARGIAIAANLYDIKGNPNWQKARRLALQGVIDADRVAGKRGTFVSTTRRIRESLGKRLEPAYTGPSLERRKA